MDEPEKGQERDKQFRSGDNSGGETPLPIPNREVKPTRADGTVPFRDGRVGRHQVVKFKWASYHRTYDKRPLFSLA